MDTLIVGVVPSNGFHCLTTIANGAVRQTFHKDINDVIDGGLEASREGKNAYYAMATFKDASARTQGNVLEIKSFWLDVDCKAKDPLKDYANKDEGIVAIQAFCKKHSMPRPTIVDSGNGWHVYWTLTEAVDSAKWQPVADKLKALCLQDGLRIDPACTADSARILRIPETFNYRFDPPSQVAVALKSSDVFFDAFSAIVELGYDSLGVKPIVLTGAPTKKEMSAATKALIGNIESTFKKILTKCAAGTGCAQITHCVDNQATLEEPMWRGVLSVAQCCTDNVKAIHFVSKDHPEYDPNYALEKAEKTKGPYTCKVFDGLNANVCTACPHWGNITSPIQLGKEVIATTAPVVVQAIQPPPAPQVAMKVETQEAEPTVSPVDLAKIEAKLVTFNQDQLSVTIPAPPAPYMRGQNGGLYKRMKNELDGTFDDVLIYENDFYAHARLFDPVDGQVLACRLHLPLDGIRNFNIPQRVIGSRDKLREIICGQGIAASDKIVSELSNYLIASAKELQHMQKEEKARTQMGWQEDGSFVLGNREYSPTGIRNCPPSNATANYQHMFRMEGDLKTWRSVVDVYKQDGFDIHRFIYFMALSSPLLQQIGQVGMLTAMISDESGIGKTTLSQLCNSIWGHPTEMMSMPHDTINAVTNRMGVFNSVSLFMDELTNKAPEVISDIVYMCSQGRGKARMAASANVERVNDTRWFMNTFASANAALRDKLASIKASSEGENMRLFEFDMRGTPVLDKAYADKMFPLILNNYGVAGHVLASWMVENRSKIAGLVRQVQRRLDKMFKFTSKERNWSASFGAAYAVALIAKELGLHDFDINANIQFMLNHIESMRGEVSESVVQHDGLVANFLNENFSSILVVDGLLDANGLQAPPRNRNINKIVARYEPDTERLYIPVNTLRDYCVAKQFSYNSLVALTGAVKCSKRISAGTGVVSGTVRALLFDTKLIGIGVDFWHDVAEHAKDDDTSDS